MERYAGKDVIEKEYDQIEQSFGGSRNGLDSSNQRFFQDSYCSINTNIRPPDFGFQPVARPVLNYSIQTGEEFALEFMRDRFNPRPQFIPTGSSSNHIGTVAAYMDVNGIPGVVGSEIRMIAPPEKNQDYGHDRNNFSANQEKVLPELVHSSSRTSISSVLQPRSTSGVSDNVLPKLKFLCSFKGKLLPRPSDGTLRYVGGEIRIIRVRKDISWEELVQKALSIYSETRSIKYQLPGEDLDALVSVSCEEDLQNMIEECAIIKEEGPPKLRMFLFSDADLDDSHIGQSVSSGDTVDKILGCRDKGTFSDTIPELNGSDRSIENALEMHSDGSMEKKVTNGSQAGKDKLIVYRRTKKKCRKPTGDVAVSNEYLVKWVGKSHIHNTWVLESELNLLAKRKLDNYKAKYGMLKINLCDERWKRPQRFISIRPSGDSSDVVLVKWEGLPYDECSWEKIDNLIISKYTHLIDSYNKFESQALEKDNTKRDVWWGKLKKRKIVDLSEQPKELKGGQLFPHQMEALNWLRKCWLKSKNVILADEMGLGKTVSACAFVSSLYNEFKATLPCLVLVPLCTMPNWMNEFSGWGPDLNVVEYHGSAKARSMIREYEWKGIRKSSSYKFNVLLTTYEMVLADSSYLGKIPWEVLVVDEGHRLKNSESKLFTVLKEFSFQHRLLMTGTPLQNNIGEMFNLLHFLQPESFHSRFSFEEKFSDLTNAEKVEELKKLVSPYMLRRLKRDVMQNIPPKTERMVPVELSSIQAGIYRAMLTKNYQILRNMGKGVAQQSQTNIVMQLRKVCNHPYLIPGTEPESGSVEYLHEMRIKASAKLSLLHLMLKGLQKQGHRVLIFSQMTKLLDILEDYLLIEFGSKTYERVDGSVSVANREAAITRFNQDKSRFVFLLSTRACGLGINLATADTVILYDSDFNPHADIQAMNRAHRIGQTNKLLVYRLFVRASVEERMLQLAKKKLMLDRLFIGNSGSQKDLEDILRWGTDKLFKQCSRNVGDEDQTVQKRKRIGSLGDVYEDQCANEESNKNFWTEIEITKLLDRSDDALSSFDNTELESENGMLGSVKCVEWNDDSPVEQIGALSTAVTMDTENDKKTEENVWDRLLQERWQNYQEEEEESLGRGKRQRKPVYYNDGHVLDASGTLREEVALDEAKPKEEADKKYSKAGIAHKAKYEKLRARQSERLDMKKLLKASGSNADTSKSSELAEQSRIGFDSKKGRTSNDIPIPSLGSNFKSSNFASSSSSSLPNAINLSPIFGASSANNSQAMIDAYQRTCLMTMDQWRNWHVFSNSITRAPSRTNTNVNISQPCPTLPPLLSNHVKNIPHGAPNLRLNLPPPPPPSFSHSTLPERLNDQWTEDELNCLWVGIRRHGLDWDTILRDQMLNFSALKTTQHLSSRWKVEKNKVLEGVISPYEASSSSSSSPGISERSMMGQSLQRRSAYQSYSPSIFSTILPSTTSSSFPLTYHQASNIHNNIGLISSNQIPPPFMPRGTGDNNNLNRLPSIPHHWLRPAPTPTPAPAPARQPHNGEEDNDATSETSFRSS